MMNASLLELKGVTVQFGGRSKAFVALEDLNLSIEQSRPKIVAVAGETGSGKTTLGRVALGLVPPTRGTITYKGRDLATMTGAERRLFRREVQAILQDPYSTFNPFYPIDHLLRMPLKTFGITHDPHEMDELIRDALERVGLRPSQVLGRYPHQLSGGQRQRIVVARSLMLKPKVIVADEPVSMIDASLRANILDRLKALRDDFGISVIYITHDLATARQVSDELYVLYRGRPVEVGDAAAVIEEPAHPYTRLLVASIPQPDPDQPWTGEAEPPSTESGHSDRSACVFMARCSHRMPICQTAPPAFRHKDRDVACYLYDPEQIPGSAPAAAVSDHFHKHRDLTEEI